MTIDTTALTALTLDDANFSDGAWPAATVAAARRWRGVVFARMDFGRADLAGIDARDCTFLDCSFARATLVESQWRHCRFYDGASEASCDFSYADLRRTTFSNCNLSMAKLLRGKLHGVVMEDCHAQGADFSEASFSINPSRTVVITDIRMVRCNLAYASFARCHMAGAVLEGCRLVHADLNDTDLTDADLRDCELHGVSSRGVRLAGADLRDAQISGLDPRAIDLSGVRIRSWQAEALLAEMAIIIDDG